MYGIRVIREVGRDVAGRGVRVEPTDSPPLQLLDGGAVGEVVESKADGFAAGDLVLHGRESGRVIRTPEGRFFEAHEPLDEYTRWQLVSYEAGTPSQIELDGLSGKERRKAKRRNRWTNFYYKDSIAPVTPAELEAAHHHGDDHALEGAH